MPARTETGFFGRILATLAARAERRRTLAIINQMDDRILQDIGATRWELRQAVLEADLRSERVSLELVHGAA